MEHHAGDWVLVGAKRRSRKAGAARTQRVGTSAATSKKALSAAAAHHVEPFDRDARVPAAKQLSIQTRVERIAAALLTQAQDAATSNASLVGAALHVAALHLSWATAPSNVDEETEGEAKTRHRLHVVSYGLGSFCSSSNAVHQLAFVHALVKAATLEYGELETTLEIYDPVMNASDREIAAALGNMTIDENESGKRVAAAPTVFFMPHCGHALYQNVVAANFEAGTLQNTLIIGNSFEAYGDRLIDAAARKASILLAVLPFVAESALPLGIPSSHNDFPLYESAFNDLSIHTFTGEQASAAYASDALKTLIAGTHAPASSTGTGSGDSSAASSVLSAAMDRELIA